MPKSNEGSASFIAADHLYPLEEFKRRMGMGRDAYRQARREGLPVHKIGRSHYVRGKDVLDWLERRGGGR